MGVLIDDLITKGTDEPYRMFTSRAEYRLLLRHDNADLRLMHYGRRLGLIPQDVYKRMEAKRELVAEAIPLLEKARVKPEAVNSRLESMGSPALAASESIAQLVKRPEVGLGDLKEALASVAPGLVERLYADPDAVEQVELKLKYAGYISRQHDQVKRFRKAENMLIPDEFDYQAVGAFSTEAREKLDRVRPRSVGQAGRISGVNPSDISVLLVALAAAQRAKKAARVKSARSLK